MALIRGRKVTPRLRSKLRVRRKISGSNDYPRLSVFRSGRHIYAQAISDVTGQTLCSASTLDKEVLSEIAKRETKTSTKSVQAAVLVGKILAQRAKNLDIEKVRFDRNGFKFCGRIKAVADGVTQAGVKI
jgi:large subunit ribosomal protein L18